MKMQRKYIESKRQEFILLSFLLFLEGTCWFVEKKFQKYSINRFYTLVKCNIFEWYYLFVDARVPKKRRV
ncbi:hypothetical protein bcgnr5372_37710 [Bacillus luti]